MTPLEAIDRVIHCLDRAHETGFKTKAFVRAREVLRELPEGELGALARSLPEWPPFPEVPAALAELRDRGWKLAILSNTDRDLIDGRA